MRAIVICTLLLMVCTYNLASAAPVCPQMDAGKKVLIANIVHTLTVLDDKLSEPCGKIAESIKKDSGWLDIAGIALAIPTILIANKVKPGVATTAGAIGVTTGISAAAKPLVSALLGDCDKTTREQAKLSIRKFKKQLSTFPEEALRNICKDLNSEFDFMNLAKLRDLVTDTSLIPNGLRYHEPDCDHVDKNRSMGCITAVASYCILKGYNMAGGFSQEVPPSSISSLCVLKADGDQIKVPFARLQSRDASCREISDLNGADCAAAASQYCRGVHYLGGVVQDVDPDDQIALLCLREGAPRLFDEISPGIIASIHSRCTSPADASNLFCVSAASQYCKRLGFTGGVMQNNRRSPHFKILCTRGDWLDAPI